MDIGGELASAVGMAEEVANDRKDDTEGLDRDMPS